MMVEIKRDYIYGLVIIGLLIALGYSWFYGVQSKSAEPNDLNYQKKEPTKVQDKENIPSMPYMEDMMDDDPRIGSDNAPIIVIEFSDFQCPYCRRFWSQTFSQLKSSYMDTGRVQFVYRDFPLSFHPAAQKAAEAAECANEQGKFWEMHDKIFEEQEKLGGGTVSFSTSDLKSWAQELGLNTEQFNECLDSGKYAEEVKRDLNDGISLGVSGTPTFYIGKRGEPGKLLVGAQPFSVFKQVLGSLN